MIWGLLGYLACVVSVSLLEAVKSGDKEAVQLLLNDGVDVNERFDESEITALMIASLNGEADFVSMLLKAGADVGAQSKDKMTALHPAAFRNNIAVAELLLQVS